MYTPTPFARRPRPPGSLTRPRTVLEQPGSGKALPSHPSVSSSLASSSSQPDAPLSTYIRRRQEYSRTGLARISASPGEVGDVSLGLDVEESKPIGLGLLSSVVEPSPPPPYGITLPDAPTPPRQDSGVLTRHSSEFRLEMELEEDEGEMSEEDVKVSLRAMRESLRLREDGLSLYLSIRLLAYGSRTRQSCLGPSSIITPPQQHVRPPSLRSPP
jgi:hypothetical protein